MRSGAGVLARHAAFTRSARPAMLTRVSLRHASTNAKPSSDGKKNLSMSANSSAFNVTAPPMQSMTNVDDLLKTQDELAETIVPRKFSNNLEEYDDVLSKPHEWFPEARALGRKLHLHVGPTNSGKTYEALQRLKKGGLGIYCGPLRLLAWQVADGLTREGYPTSLLTGQERHFVEGAALTSCTVEMADSNAFCHVAVIDEIQMLADPGRGWAWTQAVLGMRAMELHMCGDDSCVPLIEGIAKLTGEELIIHRYERLTPLSATEAIGSLASVQGGDCVVAFSRKDIYVIKAQIESSSSLRCAVVYGGLPPENRKHQAKLFNDNHNDMVLVASDAVGMGLNLKIKRVVFTTDEKFDGVDVRPLKVTEIKQIGGRAGRHGHGSEQGQVTVINAEHMNAVKEALSAELPQPETALVSPRYEVLKEQVEYVALTDDTLQTAKRLMKSDPNPEPKDFNMVPKEKILQGRIMNFSLGKCLTQHTSKEVEKRLEETKMPFRFANMESQIDIIQLLKHVPLSFEVLNKMCQAPVSLRDSRALEVFTFYAKQLAYYELGVLGEGVTPQVPFFEINDRVPSDMQELQEMEDLYRALDVCMWVGLTFGHPDADIDPVRKQRLKCTVRIQQGLEVLHEQIATQRSGAKAKRDAYRKAQEERAKLRLEKRAKKSFGKAQTN